MLKIALVLPLLAVDIIMYRVALCLLLLAGCSTQQTIKTVYAADDVLLTEARYACDFWADALGETVCEAKLGQATYEEQSIGLSWGGDLQGPVGRTVLKPIRTTIVLDDYARTSVLARRLVTVHEVAHSLGVADHSDAGVMAPIVDYCLTRSDADLLGKWLSVEVKVGKCIEVQF